MFSFRMRVASPRFGSPIEWIRQQSMWSVLSRSRLSSIPFMRSATDTVAVTSGGSSFVVTKSLSRFAGKICPMTFSMS